MSIFFPMVSTTVLNINICQGTLVTNLICENGVNVFHVRQRSFSETM